MKIRFLIALTAVVILFGSSGYALAGNTANSGSQAVAVIDSHDDSHDTFNSVTNNPRPHINPIPPHQTPNTLQPVYKDHEGNGWVLWYDPLFSEMTINQIKTMRRARLSQHITAWSHLEKNDDPIEILKGMPEIKHGTRNMGSVVVEGRAFVDVKEAIAEALYHAKKETMTKRVLILIKTKLVTTGKVRALGSVAGGGSVLGNVNEPDKLVASLSGGAGIGSSHSWVEEQPVVKVICFN